MGKRLKDHDWTVTANVDGTHSFEAAHLTVLMDLRDELKRLNSLLYCPNFIAIPRTLKRISANTARARGPRKTKRKVERKSRRAKRRDGA